jgi:hypothetical protein
VSPAKHQRGKNRQIIIQSGKKQLRFILLLSPSIFTTYFFKLFFDTLFLINLTQLTQLHAAHYRTWTIKPSASLYNLRSEPK